MVILAYDKAAGTVTVPSKNNKKVQAATENFRHALLAGSLASSIQEGIDAFALGIDTCID